MNERCIKQRALELSRYVIFHSLVVIAVLAVTYTTMQSSLAQNDSVTTSSAPNRSVPNIEIIHRPFESSAIPAVGTLMRLSVELANTYDIETKVRLVGSKDNRFIDIAFPRGALNNLDRPTFSVEIPSPIAAMTYQFIVHQRDGSLTSSRKFLLKRNCLQTFRVEVPENSASAAFQKEVATLTSKARTLERDTVSLESSLKILEEIKSSLSR